MKTDVIVISSEGANMEEALRQVDLAAEYKALPKADASVLRLLAEEMMGMVQAITGSVRGEFWLEDKAGTYAMHFRVNSLMDEKKREQLLSASTRGKNEAARGFMGRLRTFFEPSSIPVFVTDLGGGSPQMYGSYIWSMEDYRDQLRQYRQEHKAGAQEAWDELEKSVVGHLADDVKVSIRGREVEMTIVKTLG